MKLLAMLSAVTLSAIFFLLAGCGSGSQAEQDHAHQSHSAKLTLHPEGNSGASGTASFKDIEDGVIVKLELRGLPKPNTLYLAHIHPGTCSEGEDEGEAHEHGGAEFEYPLSQVKSEFLSEGGASSTTILHHTSVEKLFSGGPMHLNVHEAGSGNQPVLACVDLKEAR
jgi:hypothetical protein